MARIETYNMEAILARISDLESSLTSLIDAQAATDAVTFAPIAEPVALAEREARIDAIAQEVSDRNAAILVETNNRIAAVTAIAPKVVSARKATAATNYTINSNAAWVDVDTTLDLVLPAVVGDLIEVNLSCVWGNQAVAGFMDVVTVVSAAPANSFATNGAIVTNPLSVQGIQSWRGENGVFTGAGGACSKRMVAGDLSGGNVTLRLRAATSAAVAKTLYGVSTNPFYWSAKNLGAAA